MIDAMEAIILAGGQGTRLRELVPDGPKPMALVAGRPFLEILLDVLARKGFGRVILSLGYKADRVEAHFGAAFAGMALVYEIEQTPLGTGGALHRALAHCRSDHVYVFNGDTFLDLEVNKVETRWQQQRLPIIIAAEVADTTRYGRLTVVNGQVVGFNEKGVPGMGLINAGAYVLPIGITADFPTDRAFSLEQDYLAKAVIHSPFQCFVTRGCFIDIGVPDDYRRAQSVLAEYGSPCRS